MEIQTQQLNQLIKEFFAQFENVWMIRIEKYQGLYGWGQDRYMLFDNEQEAIDKKEEFYTKEIRAKVYKQGIPCEIVTEDPILLTPDNIHDYMGVIIKELCS